MKKLEIKDIWQPDEQYVKHRIPGMIVTLSGTLLIYNEARTGADDWSSMDIFLQRSTDGGESFGAPIILARGVESGMTVNNPVIMQDKNGRIHFLYCENYGINGGRVIRRYSDDDGITWSNMIDITEAAMPEIRNAFALGPGHGICTPSGDLVVPVWFVPKKYESPVKSHMPSELASLYSKDNGETWRMGEIFPVSEFLFSPNEAEMCVLNDGSIYINFRLGGGLSYRGRAYSPTGYSDWHGFEADKVLHDPSCFGSCISLNKSGEQPLVLFANCASKTGRNHVTVRASTDGGKTWLYERLIDEKRGGYVELAADEVRGNIYVLYEDLFGTTCHLAIFDREWLTQKTSENT